MNRIRLQKAGRPSLTIDSLNPSAIARAFFDEPWSFKLTCLYVFFEYVRPQSIYDWLNGPPWALGCITAACIAFLFEGFHNRIPKATAALLGAFSLVVFLSAFFANYPDVAIDRLNLYINWVLAFFLVANTTTTRRRWIVFMLFFLLWSLKMSQHGFRTWLSRGFSFAGWGVAGAPGWFQNSGEFALQMGIFVPLSLYLIIGLYPKLTKLQVAVLSLLPITGVASIIASSSRGGLLGLAASGIWLLLSGPKKVRRMLYLGVALPLVWLAIPAQQKARFSTAGEDETSVSRLTYWARGLEMARQYPFLGVGYENWVPYYQAHYPPRGDELVRYDESGKPTVEVAHNSFIEVVSQLGVIGFALFVALIVVTFRQNAVSRRMLAPSGEGGRVLIQMSHGLDAGTVAFVVAGSFMSVAFYPFIWFQLGITTALNTIARDSYARVHVPRPNRDFSSRPAQVQHGPQPHYAGAGQPRA